MTKSKTIRKKVKRSLQKMTDHLVEMSLLSEQEYDLDFEYNAKYLSNVAEELREYVQLGKSRNMFSKKDDIIQMVRNDSNVIQFAKRENSVKYKQQKLPMVQNKKTKRIIKMNFQDFYDKHVKVLCWK